MGFIRASLAQRTGAIEVFDTDEFHEVKVVSIRVANAGFLGAEWARVLRKQNT